MNFSIEQTEPGKYIFTCFGERHELTQDEFNELAGAIFGLPAQCFTMPLQPLTSAEPPTEPQFDWRKVIKVAEWLR